MAAGAVSDPYLRFRPQFLQLLDPDCYTSEWLDAQVWSGAFRTFGTDEACILVSMKQYPTGLWEIHGEAAAGELSEIKKLIEQACAWGRSHGCRLATIASREGWARVLSDDGWEPHQMTIRKVL